MAEEKKSQDLVPGEKIEQSEKHEGTEIIPDDAGRRKSVALNIVENPLKVRSHMTTKLHSS